MRSTGRCRRAARRHGPAPQRRCPRSGEGRSRAGGGGSRGAAVAGGGSGQPSPGAGRRGSPGGRASAGEPPGARSGGRSEQWHCHCWQFRSECDHILAPSRGASTHGKRILENQSSRGQRLSWGEDALSFFLFLFIFLLPPDPHPSHPPGGFFLSFSERPRLGVQTGEAALSSTALDF